MTEQVDTPSRKVSLPLLLLFLLSLAGNAYLLYDWYNNNYQDGKSLKEINAELQSLLSETEFAKDSLQKEYDQLSALYQSLYTESETLRIERTDALEELGQKKVRIRQLLAQSNSNPRALKEAKAEIESLKIRLTDYETELKVALDDKQKFEDQANAEKSKAMELLEEKERAENEKLMLTERLDNATFKISDLSAKPMRMRRNKWEETTKSSKVEEIEISFTILESPIIERGQKELTLRIIGTNKEVLGADNDELSDSDKLYSMKKDFTYDGKDQKFKMNFEQEESYKPGTHYAELWSEGKLITRTAFNLD